MVNRNLNAGTSRALAAAKSGHAPASSTGGLPIPHPGPYEGCADGERFRLCRVRASGTSAAMAPRDNDGSKADAAFEPRSRILGARYTAPTTAERASDADPSRSRTTGASRVTRVPAAATLLERCRADAVSNREIAAAPSAAVSSRFGVHVRGASRGSGFERGRGSVHAALAGCRGPIRLAALVVSDPFHSPTIGPAAVLRRRCGAAASGTPALMRLANGQQNAHRRDPSGGDPGGRSARQPRRGIRLRVRAPQAASRQHLSGEGDARRAVAAGRLRRLRRQPPRLPRLLRNPSGLLSNPGRRPAGADRRGRARPARRRRRGRSPRRGAAAHRHRAAAPARRDDEVDARATPAEAPAGDTAVDGRARRRRRTARATTAPTTTRRASIATSRRSAADAARAVDPSRSEPRQPSAETTPADGRAERDRSRREPMPPTPKPTLTPTATPSTAGCRQRRRSARRRCRRRRSRRSRRSQRRTRDSADDGNGAENGDDDEADEEVVESVGGADAMEEVPDRAPRYRRQYKIQEVIKRRQVMLVQVVKEERGTKGAALTTYLSLAGRYSVLMPNTARGGGISRKITSAEDRARLKEIAAGARSAGGHGRDPAHRRRQPHQDRDQARLRISAAAVGDGARPDAEIDRAQARLRGRLAGQALDPRPLQQGHRRGRRRRRRRPTTRPRTSCACSCRAMPRT